MIDQIRYYSRNLVREFGFFKTKYGDTDASYSETHALIELDRLGPLEVGELAKVLNVDKSVASRIFNSMQRKSWISLKRIKDQRKKIYQLTRKGRKVLSKIEKMSNLKVENALQELNVKEQQKVKEGLILFTKALKFSRLKNEFKIRVIEGRDNKEMAKIVKESLRELGFAGPGTAAADQSLKHLNEVYVGPNRTYFIAENNGEICGGVGITALEGGSKTTCELIRMFIKMHYRGSGLGQLLIDQALSQAKQFGYKYCYLETTQKMKAAQNLYKNNGFKYLKKRKGETGHFNCRVYMGKKL